MSKEPLYARAVARTTQFWDLGFRGQPCPCALAVARPSLCLCGTRPATASVVTSSYLHVGLQNFVPGNGVSTSRLACARLVT